jgi:sugar-specific transcriptional regulator TrmB
MQEPRIHLQNLGLSESEVTVYLAMVAGARNARDLVKVTRLKRPTVYYALGCLEKRGLVSKTGLEGDKKFQLEPLQRLSVMAEEHTLEAAKLKNDIDALVEDLKTSQGVESKKPVVTFYEGAEAVRHVIMDMLYCKSKKINSVVPMKNFFWQTGPGFLELFVDEGARRGIKAKNLWEAPIGELDRGILKGHYQGFTNVRIIPDAMKGKFETMVFLYDDKTLYVSSMKNSYCVLIASKEHYDTMQAWFDGIWSVSKPQGR